MTLNLCFIIANDKYEPSLRNLRGAEADGRVLADLLSLKLGWEIVSHIGSGATERGVLDDLGSLHTKSYPHVGKYKKVNLLVFCSSHGHLDRGVHNLVLRNGERISAQQFTEAAVRSLNGWRARQIDCCVAFVFDCCRVVGAAASNGKGGMAVARNIAALVQSEAPDLPTVFWYACQNSQPSWEAPLKDGIPYNPGPNVEDVPAGTPWRGLFCLAFERVLKRIGVGKRRRLSEIMPDVETATLKLASDTYGVSQQPQSPNFTATVARRFVFTRRRPLWMWVVILAAILIIVGVILSLHVRPNLFKDWHTASITERMETPDAQHEPAPLPIQDHAYWLFENSHRNDWIPQFFMTDVKTPEHLYADMFTFGLATRDAATGDRSLWLRMKPGLSDEGWCGVAWTRMKPHELEAAQGGTGVDLRGAEGVRFEIRAERPVLVQVKALVLGKLNDSSGPIEPEGGPLIDIDASWREFFIPARQADLSCVVSGFYVGVALGDQTTNVSPDETITIHIDNLRWVFPEYETQP
jgi:hypothetical protein